MSIQIRREPTRGPRLAAVAKFAYWLDAGIRVPGTNLRFGLDPILGLIPGAGDAAGAVPLLGGIFDFAWKANLRNVALLERHLGAPERAERADRSFVLLVVFGVLALALGLLTLGVLLTRWAFRALGVA